MAVFFGVLLLCLRTVLNMSCWQGCSNGLVHVFAYIAGYLVFFVNFIVYFCLVVFKGKAKVG